MSADVFGLINEFLTPKEFESNRQVSKKYKVDSDHVFKKQMLKRSYWHSKDRVTKHIEPLMKLASKGGIFTSYQQLWMLEEILSRNNPEDEQKTRDWLEIVTSKFQLTTQMYNICIRTIQNHKCDTNGRLAAELMKFMYQSGVPLPERVKPELLENTDAIIKNYSSMKDESLQLIEASENGNLNRVQHLLRQPGIDVNKEKNQICDRDRRTALESASQRRLLRIVIELLQHPEIDVNHADIYGYTALIEASNHDHLDIVKELLNQPGIDVNKASKFGWTALIRASFSGNLEIVKELLKQPGINVNHADNDGNTALIYASRVGHTEIVKELLKQPGINVNHECGKTALKWASHKGHKKIVRLLKDYIARHKKPWYVCW